MAPPSGSVVPFVLVSYSEDDANIFTNFTAYYFEVVFPRKGGVDDYSQKFSTVNMFNDKIINYYIVVFDLNRQFSTFE